MDRDELKVLIAEAFSGRRLPDVSDWSFVRSDDEVSARRELMGKVWQSAADWIAAGHGSYFGGLSVLRGRVFAYYLPAYATSSIEADDPTPHLLSSQVFESRFDDHKETIDWLTIRERGVLYYFVSFALTDQFPAGSRVEKSSRLQALRYFGYWHHGVGTREWDNFAPSISGKPIAAVSDLGSIIQSILGCPPPGFDLREVSESDPTAERLANGEPRASIRDYLLASLIRRVPDPLAVSLSILAQLEQSPGIVTSERVALYQFFEHVLLLEMDYSCKMEVSRILGGLELVGPDWQRWYHSKRLFIS